MLENGGGRQTPLRFLLVNQGGRDGELEGEGERERCKAVRRAGRRGRRRGRERERDVCLLLAQSTWSSSQRRLGSSTARDRLIHTVPLCRVKGMMKGKRGRPCKEVAKEGALLKRHTQRERAAGDLPYAFFKDEVFMRNLKIGAKRSVGVVFRHLPLCL
jgi:hypothetical protein